MDVIGGYQTVREIGGWETRWFIYTAYKLDDPKKTEVVLKTCLTADLPPNPPQIPASIPAFLVASNHQREAAAQCKGIAPIYASGVEQNRVFHVTKRYSLSLQRLIASKVDVTDDALEHLASDILDHLATLQKTRQHAHGNLKPANVFLEGHRNLAKADVVLADLAPRERGHTLSDDIQALGHLLHQVIRKREMAESFFPLQLSEEWNHLEGDAQKWLHCLNRFLDPALAQAPDPLKIARDSLRNSGRDAAGGSIKQSAQAIKKVGSSKALQSSLWIGLFLAIAAGAFFYLRHTLTNVDGIWREVQTKNHVWLGSVAGVLSDPKTAALWSDPASPQLRSASEKIAQLLEKSPITVQAVIKNDPALPVYDPVKDRDDRYRLEGNKGDPDRVHQLESDLAGIRNVLGNYLPEDERTRLRQFATHLAAAHWPVPAALTQAAAYDPTREAELGKTITATLPLAPLLLNEDRLTLLDSLARHTAQILPLADPLLQSYAGGVREKIDLLFREPIDTSLYETGKGDLWRFLKRRDDGLSEILTFLEGKTDRIAFDRFSENNLNSLTFPEIDDPAFSKRWIRAAEQFLALENADALRIDWSDQWTRLLKNRSGTEELNTAFQALIARPKIVKIDQTAFDDLLAQLGFIPLDETAVATTTPAIPGASPTPSTPENTVETAKNTGAYLALLQNYSAQLRTAAPGDIAAIATRFRTESAAFASNPGVQPFLNQLSLDLARKNSGGYRPKGFPSATRPNPADPLLYNIPLPGRGAFPFRLISPAGGTPFFLGVWEVPIALLNAGDFDVARSDGPRFWNILGGKVVAFPIPTWPQLQAEMIGPQSRPVAPYFSPQIAAVPGGPQNWQRLPANFVSPTTANRVATAFGLRLPTLAEWRAAYAIAGNGSDGWLRGKTWRQQVDYIISTVGARLQETYREGVAPTYPAVFPTTRAYGAFDVSQKDDFDPAATQGSLYFRPTFTAANPGNIKDMRGNVSEIVSNGARFAVVGPSALSSPKFSGIEGNPPIIPAGESFSDVGFRFAVDAVPDSGTSNIPQLFADELQRMSR